MSSIKATDPRESARLRSAVAGADQGPGDEGREVSAFIAGRSSIRQGGMQDPTHVSFPFLRRMARDHSVAMALHYIQMPLVKASFFFEADDARAAAFADNIVRPIFGSMILTICRFLTTGYSPAVKNTYAINPGWQYLVDGRKQQVWDSSVVDALVYKPLIPLRPESCRLSYENGRFNGIRWDDFFVGPGSFYINGTSLPQVDLAHSFWAAHAVESEDGDPYGFPRISHCAPIFHMYRYIWTLLGRAFEDNADPGPIVSFPKDDVAPSAGQETNMEVALRIGRRKRSGSTIALPSDVYTDFQDRMTNHPKWSISYPKSETNFVAIHEFLSYLEALKFRSLWISEQSLTGGGGGGQGSSRNATASLSSQRDASQAVLMEQIVAIIMDQIVRPAMAINMPWYEGRLEMKTIGFGKDDEDTVRQVFQLIGQNDTARLGIDIRRLAEARGFPMLDPVEQQKLLQQEAAKADAQPAPGVTPTQGRRALVTQTGFGESMYVQLNDPVTLASAEDGDFVASLPRSSTFSTPAVVDAARAIRSRTQSFLERSYRDAALFASKHRREIAALSDGDVPPESFDVASSIMDEWRPNYDALAELDEARTNAANSVVVAVLRSELRALAEPPPDADLIALTQGTITSDARLTGRSRDLVEHVRADLVGELSDAIDRDGDDLPAVSSRRSVAADVASTVAVEDVSMIHRRTLLMAGEVAGVSLCQILTGDRRGAFLTLTEAESEDGEVRLLPSAPPMILHRWSSEDDHLARYDREEHAIVLSSEITPEQEQSFRIALGDVMARPAPRTEPSASMVEAQT